jgi:hypothetical protein
MQERMILPKCLTGKSIIPYAEMNGKREGYMFTDKPIFKWLLIFNDGAHLNAEGEEIEDACQSLGRKRTDIAISRAGFPRATPLKRIDNLTPMSEDIKDHLREIKEERKTLRNNNRKKCKATSLYKNDLMTSPNHYLCNKERGHDSYHRDGLVRWRNRKETPLDKILG